MEHWSAPAAVLALSKVLLCAGVTGLVGLLVDEGSEVASLVLFFLRNPRVGIKEISRRRSNPICAGLPGQTECGEGRTRGDDRSQRDSDEAETPDAGDCSRAIGKNCPLALLFKTVEYVLKVGGGSRVGAYSRLHPCNPTTTSN